MHLTGVSLLLLFVVLVTAVMLYLLHLTEIGVILHQSLPDRPRRRLFLASISFFVTFGAVRLLVISIVYRFGPFQWVTVNGRHIHHLVWGILLLLIVGYGYLLELGGDDTPASIFASRLMSIAYGIGAAHTLDEFSLWLNLKNDYWSREGRESIDVVILFGTFLAIGTWGAPFFTAVFKKK